MRNLPAGVRAALKKYNPTLGAVHIQRPLANMSVSYQQSQEDFIADKWAPPLPVKHHADRYWTIPKDAFFRNGAQKRAPGTETAGVEFKVSDDSYICDIWGCHQDIPNPVRNNADEGLDLDRGSVELVTQQMLLAREINIATKFFTTGKWGQDWVGDNATDVATFKLKFWNQDGSTPIIDIKRILRRVRTKIGRRPNTLVFGADVEAVLSTNSDTIARVVNGTTPGGAGVPAVVTVNTIADLLRIPRDRVLVGEVSYNSAEENEAPVMVDVFKRSIWIGYVAPQPSLMTPTALATFKWSELEGAVGGTQMKRMNLDREDSTRIEMQEAWDQKLVAADCGEFVSNILEAGY